MVWCSMGYHSLTSCCILVGIAPGVSSPIPCCFHSVLVITWQHTPRHPSWFDLKWQLVSYSQLGLQEWLHASLRRFMAFSTWTFGPGTKSHVGATGWGSVGLLEDHILAFMYWTRSLACSKKLGVVTVKNKNKKGSFLFLTPKTWGHGIVIYYVEFRLVRISSHLQGRPTYP